MITVHIPDNEINAAAQLQRRIVTLERKIRQTDDTNMISYLGANLTHANNCLLRCFAEATATVLMGTGVFTSQKSFHS